MLSALHDLTLAGQFADRLLLLADGRVVAFGTPAEVLDEEVLGEAFRCAVRIIRTDDGELVIAPRRTSPPRRRAGLGASAGRCGRERPRRR